MNISSVDTSYTPINQTWQWKIQHLSMMFPATKKSRSICEGFSSPAWLPKGLVGGIPTPPKNMKISWDYYSQYIWPNKSHVPNQETCSSCGLCRSRSSEAWSLEKKDVEIPALRHHQTWTSPKQREHLGKYGQNPWSKCRIMHFYSWEHAK